MLKIIETGVFYSIIIDPMLKGVRQTVAACISSGETVIDIACGTGAQVFEIATKAKRVVGVDLSGSMIRGARNKCKARKLENVEFIEADATQLSGFSDNEFDVATMSLALHQFPPEIYTAVLSEMKRVSKRVVFIDYAVPLQNNLVGILCKTIEFMAGIEHNRCFRKYYRLGGLQTILTSNGLEITRIKKFGGGAFLVVSCGGR